MPNVWEAAIDQQGDSKCGPLRNVRIYSAPTEALSMLARYTI